jgi:hypothetical protein
LDPHPMTIPRLPLRRGQGGKMQSRARLLPTARTCLPGISGGPKIFGSEILWIIGGQHY